MTLKLAKGAGASMFALALATLPSAGAEEPLAIAKQSYFFVGGKYATVGDKQVLSGQAYVEYQIPARLTQPYPLVIVPGAAQTATNFTGTADGREGWAQFFLRRGYAVYIVEQPGRGRSSYQPDTEGPQAFPQLSSVQQRFTAPNASDMAFEQQEKADGPDLAKCWLQKAPAKQLINLAKIPIAVVHGEASFYAPYAHCLIKYMEQAGLHPTWLNLGEMGIRGNGHMMMLEKNSDQIADLMEKWVSKVVSEKAAAPASR